MGRIKGAGHGGFIAVFLVLAVLHWNAYRRRGALGFDAVESYDVGAGIRTHLLSVGVGALALLLAAVVPPHLLWLAGFSFALLGPVHFVNGMVRGRGRARVAAR